MAATCRRSVRRRGASVAAILGCVLLGIAAAGCGRDAARPAVRTGLALGTLVQIRAYDEGADGAVHKAFERVQEIEAEMSATREDSELELVNRSAAQLPVQVSRDTLYVLERALDFAELSGGKLDVSVGPLVRLWGIGTAHARVPTDEEIELARSRVGFRGVALDPVARTVSLARPGMALDLGAIAKGFAADEAGAVLRKHGVTSASIDLGGNVLVVGSRPDGSPWRVGIQDPWRPRGATVATVVVRDAAVVSSGSYERYFESGGVRYHHILDPDTGRPADAGVVSATVIARKALDADALSTIVFLLGSANGLRLLDELGSGVQGIVITEGREVIVSSGLKDSVEVDEGWVVQYR